MDGRWRAITATLLLLAGGLGGAASATAKPASKPAQAVIALVDTGINPYHQVFRDRSPLAMRYPGTYLPGYPKGAIALHITLDAKDYNQALRKDCRSVWAKVRPGQLYWFPGTKIVGAIAFGSQLAINCNDKEPNDTYVLSTGHGAMTASRAASNQYGACPECRVVSVQLPLSVSVGVGGEDGSTVSVSGLRWAAANRSWIDVQSNSWGPLVPGWAPASSGMVMDDPALTRAIEETARTQLAFWAAGNGAAFRGGVLGHPTLLAPHLGPAPIIVGGYDSGYVATWPGSMPNVASDACSSWATEGPTTTGSGPTIGSGTSAATPYVAGGAARIILEARRILGDSHTGYRGDVLASGRAGVVKSGPLADGKLTKAELKDVLFRTATARPVAERNDGAVCDTTQAPYNSTPVKWSDVPAAVQQYPLIGYGGVDTPARELAFRVLRGTAALPARAQEDALYAADQAARTQAYPVWSKP
ncbi:MAG: hypothetical protein QOG34_1615 [Frankiaceae bacterium]|nr:hypothetical protein [Frankiaceae bacterium]